MTFDLYETEIVPDCEDTHVKLSTLSVMAALLAFVGTVIVVVLVLHWVVLPVTQILRLKV